MLIDSYIHQGKRTGQEDFLYHNKENGLYIVCDGVGGSAKGEVASKLTTEVIRDLVQTKSMFPTNKIVVDRILKKVQEAFTEYIKNDPSAEGMSTTLAMAYFHDEGVTLTHLGDSRIYYLNANENVWISKDHSFVQDLHDLGVLKTQEEMEKHPMRNWITRSMNCEDEPDADVMNFDKLGAGDVFFLCTDGILEPFPNHSILPILTNRDSVDSHDNNTAILLQLEKQDAFEL